MRLCKYQIWTYDELDYLNELITGILPEFPRIPLQN